MKKIYIIALIGSLFLTGCNSGPSLQKYFVENTENKNFIILDVAPGILNLDKSKLTVEQAQALASFEKINVLAFKLDSTNVAQYDIEKTKVKEILKDKKYQQLMKFGSGKTGASVSFVGDEKHIDEFVLFAYDKENGFGVVRILGKDMNPNGIMTMMSVLKSSNIDMAQLKPLQQLLK
ncbi:MAG: DUF4252 domain-containing protein [Flavobacterium sp.]|nr:DUF4252 domain-containing protein [Flavobacterium sp.]